MEKTDQTPDPTGADPTKSRPLWMGPLVIFIFILMAGLVAAPMALSGQDIMAWSRQGLGLAGKWPWIVFYALDASAVIAVAICAYKAWEGKRAGLFQPLVWTIAGLSAFAQHKHGIRIKDTAPDAYWFFPILALIGPFILELLLSTLRKMQQANKGQIAKEMPKFGFWRWIPGIGSFQETYGAWRLARLLNIPTYSEAVQTYRKVCPDGQWRVLKALRAYEANQTQTKTVQTTNWKKPTQTKPEPTIKVQTTRVDRPEVDLNADQTYVQAIQTHYEWPQTSLAAIVEIVKQLDPNQTCGKSRAIRLRDKAKETS